MRRRRAKPRSGLTLSHQYKKLILRQMVNKGVPDLETADHLYHWANNAFHLEGDIYGRDIDYKYYVGARIFDIWVEDRFIIFKCEICGDTTVISDLNEDEKEIFADPNEPKLDELSIGNEQICADCQAAREM